MEDMLNIGIGPGGRYSFGGDDSFPVNISIVNNGKEPFIGKVMKINKKLPFPDASPKTWVGYKPVCYPTAAGCVSTITGMVASVCVIDDPCCPSYQKQEVENTMTINIERNYLDRRLNEVFYNFNRDLVKQFHLHDDTSPKSYKDVIDWIKNDKFTLNTKETKRIDLTIDEDGRYYGSFLDGIVWTGAVFTPDRDGYTAALKVLKTALQDACDVINTSDSTAGLKALQDFQNWTYTAPVATS